MAVLKQQVLPLPAKAVHYTITAIVGAGLLVYGEYTFCVFVGLKCS